MIKIHHPQPPATNGGGSLIAWQSCAATGHWGEHLGIQTGGWSVVGKIHLFEEEVMSISTTWHETRWQWRDLSKRFWKLCGQDQLLWIWCRPPQKGPPCFWNQGDCWCLTDHSVPELFNLPKVWPWWTVSWSVWKSWWKWWFQGFPTMLLPRQLKGAARFEDSFHRRGAQSTSQWGRMMGQRGWEKNLGKARGIHVCLVFIWWPSSEFKWLWDEIMDDPGIVP